MGTFIYSPQVRVHVACDGTNIPDFAGNTYDISDDLVQGSLILRTNGVHTFSFQLQNTQRKYDGVLQPMDRITVEMKRVTWVRVFSGYLNNGPLFSAWPRVLNMSASCTLKRLQFWYWDPTTTAAYQLITGALNAKGQGQNTPGQAEQKSPIAAQGGAARLVAPERRSLRVGAGFGNDPNFGAPGSPGVPPAPATPPPATAPPAAPPQNPATAPDPNKPEAAGAPQVFDDTIKGAVLKILNDVVGWPQDKVHIGAIPENWVKLASEVGNLALQRSDVHDLIGDLSKGNQQSTLNTGDAAMGATSTEAPGIVKIICDVAKGHFGAQARQAAIIGVATGLVESELRNLPGGDRDSVGVFQQRPSQGWGTVEQCMNVTYAAGKFFSRFPGNWASMDPGAVAQSVQRSALPGKYATRMAQAGNLVTQYGGL